MMTNSGSLPLTSPNMKHLSAFLSTISKVCLKISKYCESGKSKRQKNKVSKKINVCPPFKKNWGVRSEGALKTTRFPNGANLKLLVR